MTLHEVKIRRGWEPYSATFLGGTATMLLGHMSSEQFEVIRPYMRDRGFREAVAVILKLQKEALPIFRERVKDLVVNGKAASPEDLAQADFADLMWKVIFELYLRTAGCCPVCHAPHGASGDMMRLVEGVCSCARCGHRFNTVLIKSTPVMNAPAREQ